MPETLTPPPGNLARTLVRWQRAHGRHDLPWQGTSDPYRVWLSEIMLQQTQVSTVLSYYPRFLARFENVRALAAAHEDEVLGLWSGLGYYSRARNLHRCAQVVVAQWGGEFPRSAEQLQSLPGIGRSTAAAIAAFCFGERSAILDGNVKRVLSRVLAFAGDLAELRQERQLWTLAEALLPESSCDMPAYTQALMDLGATLCLPRRPRCSDCPLASLCAARAQDRVLTFPVRTRKLKRSAQALWLLVAQDEQGRVWLVKRPAKGIWAGLYSLPVFEDEAALLKAWPEGRHVQVLPARMHVLTHKDLHLHPWVYQGSAERPPVMPGQWMQADEWTVAGLPAPVRTLLESL